MTADEFVDRLKLLQPSSEELRQHNIPEGLIDEIREGYICSPVSAILHGEHNDAIFDLFAQYHTSSLQIGFIRFLEQPRAIELKGGSKSSIICEFDAELIAIRINPPHNVLLLDGSDPSFVMMKIAKTGDQFLDALIEVLEINNHGAHIKDASLRCAEKAGIKESVGFFEILLK